MEKAYCIMMNSSNRWFPKECQVIIKGDQDTLVQYEDYQDKTLKKRTIPSKYVFKYYQDARVFISSLYKQGRR